MKERMKDELWINKIKKRLEDYSEPLPIYGWERLQKELPASKQRIFPFRRWAISAAAVLLVAVSSISFWVLHSPVGDEVRRANVSALAVAPDKLPESTLPSVKVDVTEPIYQAQRNSSAVNVGSHPLVAQQIEIPSSSNQEISSSEITESIDNHQTGEQLVVKNESAETSKVETTDDKPVKRAPSGKDKLHLPVQSKAASRPSEWSLGLSVGNIGGLTNMLGNDMGQDGPYLSQDATTGKLNLSSTANGVLAVPNGKELVFKNGIPYLVKRERSITSINHKQPLSFGISVRKNLPKGFSVETGLTYTYLASDVTFDYSSEKESQKLHYLGIPVRANWNFVNSKDLTMYVSAGGAIEKCVYGKIGSDNGTVKPVQLSVMGAVGAQYNASSRVGIYVEPGVSYFFDDGSKVQTIRKENPCNFTLQAGLRLTY